MDGIPAKYFKNQKMSYFIIKLLKYLLMESEDF